MQNKLEVLDSENKISNEEIQNLIYTIRGRQVMLDSDVAMLYRYTTKNINKAVKRNIERFPEDFCFQLTEDEIENLRFQFGTSSLRKLWRKKIYSLCFYRTRNINAFGNFKKRYSCAS